ncbi:uncharacterized protein M421DRAFT_94129 [Didymella exigua CBS 183.55]|uniref:Mid2 domain-containing protein n=1 Tax=Didymella exigua CBS 183.55 TaxID=1150837 RepID=A0A6A5RGR9_9PLEO|nr:uncharacterized protein M421DRAFT_94129 [Didymella exigua CBS 183.55]KAF1926284.1 hypothetical protein M421DRAFT_94129 [Didymella exigua CBS 183.55]
MARSAFTWARAAAIAALAQQAVSQTCYYPNGNTAPSTEKACSSASGSACCPENWECLDNGLCYYAPTGLHGRYSCTDKNWNSPGCASNLCTYNLTVSGGESITQCSNHNNQWCCNGDATNVDCCQEKPEPRPFFNLQDGTAYATIGSNQASSNPTISTVTGLATSSSSGSSATSQASSAAAADSSSAAASSVSSSVNTTPITSVATSVRSASGTSGPETIYITNVITPTATADASSGGSSGGSGTNLGLIIGCAVGIPLALALVGTIIWMLRKRRQAQTHPYTATPDGGESPHMASAALASHKETEVYRHSRPGTAEIDSNPVGPGRPTSTIPGKAELDSGAGFQPGSGTPFAPDTAFLGGGTGNHSTWGSSPPGYSPGQGQSPFAHNHEGAVELDSSMIMPVINEKSEHQLEYQAYRPPSNAVELNAVTTPPEDVEKPLSK